jgi:hypothetical protein
MNAKSLSTKTLPLIGLVSLLTMLSLGSISTSALPNLEYSVHPLQLLVSRGRTDSQRTSIYYFSSTQTWQEIPDQLSPHPIVWSPDGQYFAFLNQSTETPLFYRLHVSDRAGKLKSALYGEIPYSQLDSIYNLRWLIKDNLTQYVIQSKDKQYQIIESQLSNGQLTRILFTFDVNDEDYEKSYFKFFWAPDANTVTVFRPFNTNVSSRNSLGWAWVMRRINLKTNILQNETTENNLLQLFSIGQARDVFSEVELCDESSPQGNYLAAILRSTDRLSNSLVLLDQNATPVKFIPDLGTCPIWTLDETYLYAQQIRQIPPTSWNDVHYEYRFLEYNLLNNMTLPFSNWYSWQARLLSRYQISPDRKAIASSYRIYLSELGVETTQVFLLPRGGVFEPLKIPFTFSSRPVWIPPIITRPAPTPAIIVSTPMPIGTVVNKEGGGAE